MSDGVLDPSREIHILVNLVGVRLNAVRAWVGNSVHEVRHVRSLGHDVVLVLGCPTAELAQLLAEIFWEHGIPARICDDPAEEMAFIESITHGKEDAA